MAPGHRRRTSSYNFPLNRAFENLPGSVALSIRAQRAMEAKAVRQEFTNSPTGFASANLNACGAAYERSDPQNNTPGYVGNTYYPNGLIANRYTCVDMVGQIRSSTFIPGVGGVAEVDRQRHRHLHARQPHHQPVGALHRWRRAWTTPSVRQPATTAPTTAMPTGQLPERQRRQQLRSSPT